jgi:hypothetical protein
LVTTRVGGCIEYLLLITRVAGKERFHESPGCVKRLLPLVAIGLDGSDRNGGELGLRESTPRETQKLVDREPAGRRKPIRSGLNGIEDVHVEVEIDRGLRLRSL